MLLVCAVPFQAAATEADETLTAVSYTHLDVYKRQAVLRFSFIRKNSVAACTQVSRSLLPAQESLNANLFCPHVSD